MCHKRNGFLFVYSNGTQQLPVLKMAHWEKTGSVEVQGRRFESIQNLKHVMILVYLFSEARYATVAVEQYNDNGHDNGRVSQIR